MKKISFFLSAALVAFAATMVSCSVEDNAANNSDNGTKAIPEGTDLATALSEYSTVVNGVPTLNLPSGINLTMNEPIELNVPLAIKGNKANPATITIGENGAIVTSNAILIEGVNIDATAQKANLISMNGTAPEEWATVGFEMKDVNIKGLQKSLFYSASKNWLFPVFSLDNCVIEVAQSITVIDFTKGGAAEEINMNNCTFYAPTATGKEFYSSQSGQKVTEAGDDLVQAFNITNCTMYNLTKGKNFFSHRQNSQKWLTYNVKNNVFVNCGKKGQTIIGLNKGSVSANPTWDIVGNVFNFEGEDTSALEETGDADEPVKESIAAVVSFADPENGDFSQTVTTAGDPRWIVK